MRMLDLFCGRGGWTNAFLERGWECIGIDLVRSPDYRGEFIEADVLQLELGRSSLRWQGSHEVLASYFDFICASPPCEQFSVHGMKHFHPNPPYPELGIKLFNHTRQICEASGVPYVIENVRAAQQFVGQAVHHCGPFYLWGTGVPVLMAEGIIKGFGAWDRKYILTTGSSKSKLRAKLKAKWATIPPELAHCVAEYAERLLELDGHAREAHLHYNGTGE